MIQRFSSLLTVVSICLLAGACRNAGKKAAAQAATENIAILPIHVEYPPTNPQEAERWKQVIESYYDTVLAPKLNGQVLVVKNGEVLLERYNGQTLFGKDSLGTITAHTPLHLASVTKTFTAMAILKLQEAGKLNIDNPVTKYLPGFPYPAVTLKMLLTHRSGLINYVHNLAAWGWPEDKMATNEDLLALINQLQPPLQAPPGIKFSYCNTNYALLALIIEKASGKTYSDYLQQTIFKPLQMNDTYVFQPKDTATATPSYDWKGRLIPFNFLDGVYGDKNVYSTVRDLYKWDQALYTNLLFSKETLAAAFSGYSFEKPGIRNYGLGWRILLFDNQKKIVFHNGWWHGNNNAFLRLTQDSATIIVLGNKFSRANYSVLQLSYLFGDYPFEAEAEEGADSTRLTASDSLMIKTIKLRADSVKIKKTLPAKAPLPDLHKDSLPAALNAEKEKKTGAKKDSSK
jgi:CubicO group peptidase (beta-lactamase class C family)